MSKILLAIALIGLLVAALFSIPWPDITIMLESLSSVLSYLFTFNKVFPVNTALFLGSLAFVIELGMFGYRLVAKFVTYITGHQAPTDYKKI